MRSIAKKVPATAFTSNTDTKQTYRVIGSLDINGEGTEHDIADVDPFIFLDETCMSGSEPWPFPKHPHSGLVAMTYMLEGEVCPWDNLNGKSKMNNRAGGLYYINSGHGIIHEEEPIVTGGPLRWLQLWMNPGVTSDALPRAATQLALPEQIPVHQSEGSTVHIIIGEAFEKTSPVKSDWPMKYLHVLLRPQHKIILHLPDPDCQGFIYLLSGSGVFGSNNFAAQKRDCLILGKEVSAFIEVFNDNKNDVLEFIFVSGKPQMKPFYKILCGGGALIAETEQAARAAKQRFLDNPDKFD